MITPETQEEREERELARELKQIDDDTRMIKSIVGSPALAKACMDAPFDYALRLKSGEVIDFSGATIVGPDWIHLYVKPADEQRVNQIPGVPAKGLIHLAERGMDVRISEIVWVMDAPMGS